MTTIKEMATDAGLSFADIEFLTGGVITENMLKKHNNGLQLLSPENYQKATRFIASWKSKRAWMVSLVEEPGIAAVLKKKLGVKADA